MTAPSFVKPITFIHIAFVLIPMLMFSGLVFPQVASDALVDDPQPLIEVTDSIVLDTKIQKRLKNIYEKIDGLNDIEVRVDAGVVTLSGNAPNEATTRSALDIAIRTSNVVTVRDEVNRTLDVSSNVRPLLHDFQSALFSFTRALPLIILAIIILLGFIFISGLLANWTSLWKRIAPNPFLSELLSQAVRIAIIAIGAVIALNLLGASKFITTILGGAGVLGIAIGFAVRDSLENYISSIMLSLRQPFRAKDYVLINQHEGIVVRLTSRATILMTLDGNHLRIPNSIVFKGIILNYSTNPQRRFDFQLGVDADDDPLLAMQVGLSEVNKHKSVLSEPNASASIVSIGDSSIIIKFTGWVDQTHADFSKVRSIAIVAAKTALEKNGFTLPEPIYRIRFDQPNNESSEFENAKVIKNKPITEKNTTSIRTLDVSIDEHLQEKVNEERAKDRENDLLDQSQPIE